MMNQLKELVAYHSQGLLEGSNEDQKSEFLTKLADGIKVLKDDLPTFDENIIQSLTFGFKSGRIITLKSIEEVLVAFKIFETHLKQEEKKFDKSFGYDRRRDGLFIYRMSFDRCMRLVQDIVWREQSKVRKSKMVESLLKSFSLEQIQNDVKRYEDFDEKIEVVDSTLKALHESEYVQEYIPDRIKSLELDLLRFRSDLAIEKAFQHHKVNVDSNYQGELEKMHLDYFYMNGFKLFDKLMKDHLSSGKLGWQSDVAFFYRMMKDYEMAPLIHATQKSFNLFLSREYPDLDPMGKYKVWDDIDIEKRRQAYKAAKEAIGLK